MDKYEPEKIEPKWPHSVPLSGTSRGKQNYNPAKIEPYWQKKWEEKGLYRAIDFDKRQKKYILIEFPYPSGERLHVGHGRSYTALDAVSRKLRMQGFNVLYPIGWDAFGLPAENYAIKTGINPAVTTAQNIENSRAQAKAWGLSFDWSREINTTDPKYYKWTQWIFLKMYDKGLAYKAEVPVSWCPACRTNLANEEVVGGKCERCGATAQRRTQSQWMLRITKYAQRLLDDLSLVDYLPQIKTLQENWIGRSEGTTIKFPISLPRRQAGNFQFPIEVFTTRPDTLFGVTAMVLAPEHPLVGKLTKLENKKAVEEYLNQAEKKSELERTDLAKEKTGVFTGSYCLNPIRQLADEKIPIWVGDYVIGWYGGGAVMVVPAHDQRDWEFAKKYNLPIKPVIVPAFEQTVRDKDHEELLIQLLKIAQENNKSLIVGGGWAADLHVGLRARNHEDLDLYVPFEDVLWWKGQTEKMGFIQKILDPKKDKRYYIEMSKEDNHPHYLWIDFVGIGTNERGELYDMEHGKVEKWGFKEKDAVLTTKFRDFQVKYFAPFVKEWYTYKIREKDKIDLAVTGMASYEGEGILVNSEEYSGLDSEEAREKISNYLEKHQLGHKSVQYKLRDWVFSRQHYWGEPIPIVFCPNRAKHKISNIKYQTLNIDGVEYDVIPVPEEKLPVELPPLEKYQPTGTGESPLAQVENWVSVACPECGEAARRETDTMPNWGGSNWYFLRYCDPQNDRALADREKLDYWMPVDLYNGGMEHTTLHLLYSRFVYKFLSDIGVVPGVEPYARRHSHGVVLGPDGQKMSKSRGNVINPDDVVKAYGADTFRLYEMFIGPFEQMVVWSEEGISGCHRFLKRVWQLSQESVNPSSPFGAAQGSSGQATPDKLKTKLHQTIKKVGEDLDALKFNTAIAAMMEFINGWAKPGEFLNPEELKIFLQILAPFAPHITEELWSFDFAQAFGSEAAQARRDKQSLPSDTSSERKQNWSIHQQPWPEYDPKLAQEKVVTIVVQINGKLREKLELESKRAGEQEEVEKQARKSEKIKSYLTNQKIKKVVFVPMKLINFVIS